MGITIWKKKTKSFSKAGDNCNFARGATKLWFEGLLAMTKLNHVRVFSLI